MYSSNIPASKPRSFIGSVKFTTRFRIKSRKQQILQDQPITELTINRVSVSVEVDPGLEAREALSQSHDRFRVCNIDWNTVQFKISNAPFETFLQLANQKNISILKLDVNNNNNIHCHRIKPYKM